MHELAIAEEIGAIVLARLKEHSMKKVTALKLEFGEMTSVVPEALDFAFTSVAKGTAMEGAKLSIKIIKVRAKCLNCGNIYRVKDIDYTCPKCKENLHEIIEGRDMIVKTIEME